MVVSMSRYLLSKAFLLRDQEQVIKDTYCVRISVGQCVQYMVESERMLLLMSSRSRTRTAFTDRVRDPVKNSALLSLFLRRKS